MTAAKTDTQPALVLQYLRRYRDDGIQPVQVVLTLILMGVLLWLNYRHGLERNWVYTSTGFPIRMIASAILYLLPLVLALVIFFITHPHHAGWRKPQLWLVLLVACLLFAARVHFKAHQPILLPYLPAEKSGLYLHALNWIVRAVFTISGLWIFWKVTRRESEPFYGMQATRQWKPYVLMLLLMLPLCWIAARQPDFQQMYPRIQPYLKSGMNSADYLFFEVAYAVDFFSIELFFRGFLILVLSRYLGTAAILPVACFYCTIHFGKPMGEAIGSLFGGWILGIVVYYSRSIWGGLLVHLGIALLMELLGFFFH